MTGRQIAVLVMLALLVAAGLCVAAFLVRPLLLAPGPSAVVRESPAPAGTPAVTPSETMVPTWTPTPLPLETPLPTETATRVVPDTSTPTTIPTPTYTLVISTTETPNPKTTSGTVVAVTPKKRAPTATPKPPYTFNFVASQVYTTANSFFVVYAQIRSGNALVGGYRIVGTHQPSGLTFESAPSCYDLCKASGPRLSTTLCCNPQCTPEASSLPPNVQEGNVAFEAPVYETGTYYLKILDPQGQQVSDIVVVPIDAQQKQWFYFVFNH